MPNRFLRPEGTPDFLRPIRTVFEIKRQPETVAREVLHYLRVLKHQRAQEEWADVLPSREVEQDKLDILDGK